MKTTEQIIDCLVSAVSKQTREEDIHFFEAVLQYLVHAAKSEQVASLRADFDAVDSIFRQHTNR